MSPEGLGGIAFLESKGEGAKGGVRRVALRVKSCPSGSISLGVASALELRSIKFDINLGTSLDDYGRGSS